jgi:hypothetical protein
MFDIYFKARSALAFGFNFSFLRFSNYWLRRAQMALYLSVLTNQEKQAAKTEA